ncbi:MAG: polymer-forming cytoskeletal protein, partial [candidate division WOR-3 bacterium]
MKKIIPLILLISFAFAGLEDFQTEPCAHTVAGDFYLKSTDTLEQDVSVSGGNATIDGVIKGDLAVMGGSVIINGSIDGDVAVFGGEIENNGKIMGDAAVAGGSVKNKGRIEGDIAVAGGTVDLDSGSVVAGDIAIVGGSVDRSDYATVNGEITTLDIGKFDRIMPKIGPLLRLHQKGFPFRRIFVGFASIASLAVMYILNLLALLIFPRAIESIEQKIQKNIWIAIAIGVGLEILFVPLIILFA